MKTKPARREKMSPSFEEKLANIFTYQPPDDVQKIAYKAIREKAKELAFTIYQYTPPCADQSAAIRHLREATMTANAAIALKGLI